ncbi:MULTISPECIES: hypothetical protein [unclassified Pseudomonas]|uniref:hypothetical protein n=1 Tax=unclassified Pseudomonas TaxID=196821 RepID=UPI0021148536|nr:MULTISPECIES: hypothetical protein [unclassified Pseudomonas]
MTINGINPGGTLTLVPPHIKAILGSEQRAAPVASGGTGYTRPGMDVRALGAPGQVTAYAGPLQFPGMPAPQTRHVDFQNIHGGMQTSGNPYVSSSDSLLATAFKNNFSELDKFKKDGKLTQSSLQKIAAEKMGESEGRDRNIMLAKAILNRPRLNEAIIGNAGKITEKSLAEAADSLVGNTDPNTQSADPFHSMSNAQLVKTFRGVFDDLRDKSEDRSFFFEKHRYVNKDKLIEMGKDPDEVDKSANVVLDPANGLPKKKYSEQQVYMAKNLIERPGLLASLDSTKANGTNIFGSHNDDGWLKNYSIDRWLKNDKKEKGM